jgi:hypothetical protein
LFAGLVSPGQSSFGISTFTLICRRSCPFLSFGSSGGASTGISSRLFVSLSSRRLSITTGVLPYPLPSRSNHTFTGTVVPPNLNAFTRARTVNLFLIATGSGSSTTSAMATSFAVWFVPGSPTATV